jgi:hypothetical protein
MDLKIEFMPQFYLGGSHTRDFTGSRASSMCRKTARACSRVDDAFQLPYQLVIFLGYQSQRRVIR